MTASQAITEFMRHLREGDLPDAELFALKADAFDLLADAYAARGPMWAADAAEAREIAVMARARSEREVGS